MRFQFNENKAAEAAAFMISLHGGEIQLLALIKLLYLAERRALIETGFPITGDRLVSMPHGPVLSRIYDEAKFPESERVWCRYIQERSRNRIQLKDGVTANFDELSEFEMDVLRQVHEEHRGMTAWQLRDLSHALPEWRDPDGSSLPIDPQEIMRLAGCSEEQIRSANTQAETTFFLQSMADR